MITERHRDMLGRDVIVRGPADEWRGRALAIADQPSIIIEQEGGERMTLPLAWAELDPQQRDWMRTAGVISPPTAPAHVREAIAATLWGVDHRPSETPWDQVHADHRESYYERADALILAKLTIADREREPEPIGASQDFRDGTATAAHLIAWRVSLVTSFGVELTTKLLEEIVETVRETYGGQVQLGEDDLEAEG